MKLKAAGVLNWLRRCREGRDELGRFRLEQETNAYAILPASQWKSYQAPPEPPPAPESGTWGDRPTASDTLALAARERFTEAARTVSACWRPSRITRWLAHCHGSHAHSSVPGRQ